MRSSGTTHILYLLALCMLSTVLPHCGGGGATPPIVYPNGGSLNAEPAQVPVPTSVDSDEPSPSGDCGDCSGTAVADIVIESTTNAFFARQTVETGFDLPTGFVGNSPRLGPVEDGSVGVSYSFPAASDGSIQLGVYVSTTTTPGTYTIFAEQEDLRYTVQITITAEVP